MNSDKIDRIKDILGPDGGLKVPEGFFEKEFDRIRSQLPPYPEAPKPERLSAWHRVRPYVYMAAMFAGIWLMMQVFHRVSTTSSELTLENIPENVALAMANSDQAFTTELYSSSTASDFELESDVAESYENIEEFEKDFGYEFEPEYENIDIPDSELGVNS